MGRLNVKEPSIHQKETTPFHVLFCKAKQGQNNPSHRNSQTSLKKEKQEVSEKVSQEFITDKSSEFMMSDIDDKNDPNYFVKNEAFFKLPTNVRLAIEKSKQESKHSDFYHRLTELNEKIQIYNRFFRNKKPAYQLQYESYRVARTQVKQKRDREIFEENIKQVKKKLATRLPTTIIDVSFIDKASKLDNLLD